MTYTATPKIDDYTATELGRLKASIVADAITLGLGIEQDGTATRPYGNGYSVRSIMISGPSMGEVRKAFAANGVDCVSAVTKVNKLPCTELFFDGVHQGTIMDGHARGQAGTFWAIGFGEKY